MSASFLVPDDTLNLLCLGVFSTSYR